MSTLVRVDACRPCACIHTVVRVDVCRAMCMRPHCGEGGCVYRLCPHCGEGGCVYIVLYVGCVHVATLWMCVHVSHCGEGI